MRSYSFALIVNQIGLNSFVLENGYKSYRKNVNEGIKEAIQAEACVFYGFSGTGKTNLLRDIQSNKNTAFMDLELFADHRGSRFGGVGLNPNSQKQFESYLWEFMKQKNKPDQLVLIEGESRQIGRCTIPENIYLWMSNSQTIWLELPLEIRAANLVSEYISHNPGDTVLKNILSGVQSLAKDKGQKFTNEVIGFIKTAHFHEAAVLLLKDFFVS